MDNHLTPVTASPMQQKPVDESAAVISGAAVEVDLYERSLVAVREHRAMERQEADKMLLTLRS